MYIYIYIYVYIYIYTEKRAGFPSANLHKGLRTADPASLAVDFQFSLHVLMFICLVKPCATCNLIKFKRRLFVNLL